jgi:hypothetical protein
MNESLTGVMVLMGILMLMALLVQKELATVAGARFQRVVKILNIGIIPLLVTFVLIVASRVIQVIR